MLTRRAFITAVGGAAVLTTRSTSGAQYDLLVKGGRVIDPSSRLDRMADVAAPVLTQAVEQLESAVVSTQ